MPGDGLALAVFVSGEVDGFRFFCRFFELIRGFSALSRDDVAGSEIVFKVDPQIALGKIPDMTKRGLHQKVLTEET